MIFLFYLIFQIEISSIIFLTNLESVLSLYFTLKCFEVVKEFHKFRPLILINRTTLHLIFVGHQVRKNTCKCLSKIKVQLHSSFIIPKTINLSLHCQQVSTRIGSHLESNLFPCYFTVNLNKNVHLIALQKYGLFLGVD